MVEGGYASEVVTGGATCVPGRHLHDGRGQRTAAGRDHGRPRSHRHRRGPRRTVVMHGAAGAVGQIAVQLAVHAGARVIGTASARNQQWLRELGAEPVTYGPGLIDRIRSWRPGRRRALDLWGPTKRSRSPSSWSATGPASPPRQRRPRARARDQALGAAPGAEPGPPSGTRPHGAGPSGRGRDRERQGGGHPLAEAAEAWACWRPVMPGKIVLVP